MRLTKENLKQFCTLVTKWDHRHHAAPQNSAGMKQCQGFGSRHPHAHTSVPKHGAVAFGWLP
jgi:hypothetical protein